MRKEGLLGEENIERVKSLWRIERSHQGLACAKGYCPMERLALCLENGFERMIKREQVKGEGEGAKGKRKRKKEMAASWKRAKR